MRSPGGKAQNPLLLLSKVVAIDEKPPYIIMMRSPGGKAQNPLILKVPNQGRFMQRKSKARTAVHWVQLTKVEPPKSRYPWAI